MEGEMGVYGIAVFSKFASNRRGVWDSQNSWPLKNWRVRLDSRTRRAWKGFGWFVFALSRVIFANEPSERRRSDGEAAAE